MIQTYNSILLDSDIEYILNLPEIALAKQQIDKKNNGSIYFSIPLTPSIKNTLYDSLGLEFTNINSIPMRWIKGDTIPHVDNGIRSFQNTYLMYLTDSDGEFIIENESYPITKGSTFVFNEGLHHETTNTGSKPRLLLGPMSEEGFAVGAPFTISGDGGTTAYIRENSGIIEHSYDNEIWNTFYFPCAFYNNNIANGVFKIEFTTDITLQDGTYQYFLFNSDYIQVGSTSLNNNGTKPTITINNIANYPGLITNGSLYNNGQNEIHIYNLHINPTGTTTLATDGGWICQTYFSRAATSNYIINCSVSTSTISNNAGGIVGSNAGFDGGNLKIIGCNTSGTISDNAGGIIGPYAGAANGDVTCESCYSDCVVIGIECGGIVGPYAGATGGIMTVTDCYQTGIINGQNSGGIVGPFGGSDEPIIITNCYSTGAINGESSGGIMGPIGYAYISNCYTTGIINSSISAGGICGSDTDIGTIITHCYVAGATASSTGYIIGNSSSVNMGNLSNNYSEAANSSSGWNNTHANNTLTGTPSSIIGTTWVSVELTEPYELYKMGYTPYTIENIDINSTPSLKRSFPISISVGNSTSNAIISGKSYNILQIINGDSGSYNTINVNNNTGVISTTSNTQAGVYTLYIRNTGSYNITTVILTLSSGGPLPCLTKDTMVLTPSGYINISKLNKGDYVITSDKRKVKIINIYNSTVEGNKITYPYIIPKDSIAKNYPAIETQISGNHLIHYANHWIHPILSKKFYQNTNCKTVNYYHIQLEDYKFDHLVINYGFVVESFGGFKKSYNNVVYEYRLRDSYYYSNISNSVKKNKYISNKK